MKRITFSPEQIKRLDELANGAKPKPGKWANLPEQHASTLVNMERQAKGEERDWGAPIEGWKAERDAEKIFKAREGAVDEVAVEERRRRAQKNTEGESKLSATTPELRDRAIHHFEVSGSVPGAAIPEHERSRITGLIAIVSKAPAVVWKKLSPWQAFVHWLRGGKVKADNE